jgi:hypothetical protein
VSDKLRRYCETQGAEPIDWWKSLDTLKASGKASEYHYSLLLRANGWATCACGNACTIIPRDGCGAPLDSKLRALGTRFANEVRDLKCDQARKTLRQIELRSAELLAEMGRKEL